MLITNEKYHLMNSLKHIKPYLRIIMKLLLNSKFRRATEQTNIYIVHQHKDMLTYYR